MRNVVVTADVAPENVVVVMVALEELVGLLKSSVGVARDPAKAEVCRELDGSGDRGCGRHG